MLNYISAELYKVRHRRITWVLLALLLAGECLYFLLGLSGRDRSYGDLLTSFLAMLMAGMPLAALLCAVVCSDMGGGGLLKNELGSGLTRRCTYLGKLLSAVIISLITLALVVGLCLVVGWLFTSHPDPAQGREARLLLLRSLAASLPLWLGGLALAQMLFFLIPSPGLAEVIYMLWFFVGDWGVSLIGDSAVGLPAAMRQVLRPLLLSAPFVWMEEGVGWGVVLHNWLVGLGWVCATCGIGILVFQHREIR